MPEQLDIIAENEKLQLITEVELFIVKATAKNLKLMSDKLGGNIGIREHAIFQRTLLDARKTIETDIKIADDDADPVIVIRRGG